MECVPCSTACTAGMLVRATTRLTALALANGFTIYDVPGDGNCLFNAIAYQLQSTSASEIRVCCKTFRN